MLQVLRRYIATGEITALRANQAVEDYFAFPILRYAHDLLVPGIWELRANFTAYDGAYVALAEALDVPLITRDRKLASAPGHRARIELI